MPRDVEITNIKQLATFAKNVRSFDKEIGRKIPKGLRELGKPALVAARQAALNIPAEGSKSTGLRREIAKALVLSASGSRVSIRVNPVKMPPGKKSLPKLLEGPQPFRHPVFADSNTWVSQPARPWFNKTMDAHAARVRAGIQKLCHDILTDLARKVS